MSEIFGAKVHCFARLKHSDGVSRRGAEGPTLHPLPQQAPRRASKPSYKAELPVVSWMGRAAGPPGNACCCGPCFQLQLRRFRRVRLHSDSSFARNEKACDITDCQGGQALVP